MIKFGKIPTNNKLDSIFVLKKEEGKYQCLSFIVLLTLFSDPFAYKYCFRFSSARVDKKEKESK